MNETIHETMNGPAVWKVRVHMESGEIVEAPGIHTHTDAFATGLKLAEALRSEGQHPKWVHTVDAEEVAPPTG